MTLFIDSYAGPCSVRAGAVGSYRLILVVEPLIPKPSQPITIQEVLDKWDDGYMDWMWQSLLLTGTDNWLMVEAIRRGLLVAWLMARISGKCIQSSVWLHLFSNAALLEAKWHDPFGTTPLCICKRILWRDAGLACDPSDTTGDLKASPWLG